MRNLLIVVSLSLILLVACDKDTSPNNAPDISQTLNGTWQEKFLTRYDLDDQIIEKVSMDTARISKRSYFDNILQSMSIDLQTNQFHYISYCSYMCQSDSLYLSPDSLVNVTGTIHYWDPESGKFYPPINIQTYPFTSHIWSVDHDVYIETRIFQDCRLEIIWERIENTPVDLNPELETYRNLLKPANRDYDVIRAALNTLE